MLGRLQQACSLSRRSFEWPASRCVDTFQRERRKKRREHWPSGLRMINMAALVSGNLNPIDISHTEQLHASPSALGPTVLLDIVQACLHTSSSEWIFLRELRVGTGFKGSAAQRLDAFALNCLPHTSMKRVCYEVKTSRADFLCEMKQPMKRRIGLRYSNEFYFVAPARLLNISEIPVECGLIEIGSFTSEERNSTMTPFGTFAHFDSDHSYLLPRYCTGPMARNAGPDVAICCRYVTKPAKSVPGSSSEAAEPTTIFLC